jgi:hypothetical protein
VAGEKRKTDKEKTEGKERLSPPDFAAREKEEKKEAFRRKKTKKKNQPEAEAESFERFWSAYPRKVAKEAARRAWAKAIEGGVGNPDTLIAGAQRYAAERAGQDPKYTKHPATWLNAGCWQDEMPPGAVIDQGGAIVAIEQPPPQQQPRQRGIVALGEELAQWIEANGNKWIGEF